MSGKVDVTTRRARPRAASASQGGFTMIEGLVVIALLAILGGIATFAVTQLNRDADETACLAERRSIEAAMWAARSTLPSGDDYRQYLSGNPKYFEDQGTPVAPHWAPNGEHPGGGCPDTIPLP